MNDITMSGNIAETWGVREMSTEHFDVRVTTRRRGRCMIIRKWSYRKRLLHCKSDSSVYVFVYRGETPGYITKELVNCGEMC
jgi:hypothetical protein